MTNVVQFRREERPEVEHVTITVENGQPVHWYEYACTFDHDGKKFAFSIWAKSFEDAEARMASLRATAYVDGQIYARIPE